MRKRAMLFRFYKIFFLILIVAQPLSAEKRWSIRSVDINARVDSAGYMMIEEKRAYEFRGKYTHAYYTLALAGLLEVDAIALLEDGEPYQLSRERLPGTFSVERDSKAITVRWHFREKSDWQRELREFTLRFRVLGAVRVHRDVAELYYQFIGTGWDRASEKVRVNIQLPGPPATDEVRAWAHGPLHGQIEQWPAGRATMAVEHLPRHKFWEGRIVFPKHYAPFAPASIRDEHEALSDILQEEERWTEAANRAREETRAKQQWQADNREIYWPWLWLGIGAGLLILFYMYQRYGQSLRRRTATLDLTLPADMPPAIANYVYHSHQATGGALLATLFDLAARGYLQLHQKENSSRFLGFTSKKQEVTLTFDEEKIRLAGQALLPYERQLLEFLQITLAQNRSRLGVDEIKKQASQFRRFFGKWKKTLAAQAGHPKLFESASIRASFITFGIWLSIIAANAFAIYALGDSATPFLIVSILAAPLSWLILRYHPETAAKLDRLRAFRRYLKRFPKTFHKHSVEWQQADRFLIYAVALGISGPESKKLLEIFERERAGMAFPWFIHGDGNTAGSLAPAVASLVEVAGTALSSASGAGGGASGGGGGGAGGSGGGAG
jgi:uncharacterized membrane protein